MKNKAFDAFHEAEKQWGKVYVKTVIDPDNIHNFRAERMLFTNMEVKWEEYLNQACLEVLT